MRSAVLLLLLGTHFCLGDGYMDWCEYWARMGKKDSHPECVSYQLPENAQMSPEKPFGLKKGGLPKCDAMEMLGCPECEARCDRDTKLCGKKRCTRRSCICRGDLFRDDLGNCVTSCPKNQASLLSNVQRMVPLLLKDMWRSVFRAFRTTTRITDSSNSTSF